MAVNRRAAREEPRLVLKTADFCCRPENQSCHVAVVRQPISKTTVHALDKEFDMLNREEVAAIARVYAMTVGAD